MVARLIDVPQTREAPEHIRRALRELDETAEVIAISGRRWIVGRVRPTRDTYQIATRMLANYWRMPAAARKTARSVQRYHFALAALQGFRPVADYTLRELDDRVVKEFKESQWRMRHQRTDLLDEWDRAEMEQQAANRAALRDESAAKNVLDYARTSNFGYAVSSVASSRETPVPSGRTRHSIPA